MTHSSLPCYVFPFSSLHCNFYSDLTCFRSLSGFLLVKFLLSPTEKANSRTRGCHTRCNLGMSASRLHPGLVSSSHVVRRLQRRVETLESS